jgi:hypothetical protein
LLDDSADESTNRGERRPTLTFKVGRRWFGRHTQRRRNPLEGILWATFLALLGLSASRDLPTVTTAATPAKQVVQASVNPFTEQTWGLPHHVSACGTYSRHYLRSEIALETIDRAFREAGYHMLRRYQINRDGMTLIADGYDPEHRLGFVFATYGNLGPDASDAKPPDPDTPPGHIDWLLEEFSELAKNDGEEQALNEIRRIQKLTDSDERHRACCELFRRDWRARMSLDEARNLVDRSEIGIEFIAVISQFDLRLEVSPSCDAFPRECVAIDLIPDSGKRRAMHELIKDQVERKVTGNLYDAVQNFICWAKSRRLR